MADGVVGRVTLFLKDLRVDRGNTHSRDGLEKVSVFRVPLHI